jgi:RNA polymerase sigma-70 factor (ECF subfamily)
VSRSRHALAPAPPPPGAPLRTADVFAENATFAWRVLRRLGVAEGDADDVCQEVFVTVHRRLPEFDGQSAVRAWVYGICVRMASDYRKRARFRREVPGAAAPEPAIAPEQEDEVRRKQALTTLDGILDRLDDDKRAVFVLYEFEELGMSDVASIVGCPVQTAYTRLHAARAEVEAAVRRIHARSPARSP